MAFNKIAMLRVAKEGLASLYELQTIYSHEDLADMLEFLDFNASCENYVTNRNKAK